MVVSPDIDPPTIAKPTELIQHDFFKT